MNKKYYILATILVLVGAIYFILRKEAKSELIYFSPQSCLGSFINPEKAQGEPEVSNPDLINESNSAVYLGGFKEIYCGDFQGPVKDGEIQKITLKFNMVLTNERRETPIVEPTSSQPLIEKIFPPKTIEIVNTSTENTQTNTSTETTTTSTIEIPQSFFYKLVFAQETQTSAGNTQTTTDNTQTNTNNTQTTVDNTQTNASNIQTNTSTSSYSSSDNTSDVNSSSPQVSTTSSSTGTQETTSTPITETSIEPTFNYFDVFYTLDGVNWQYLGSITNQNWQNISFSIPVNDWLTVSKIQIKLQSNPTLENIPYLYLESMNLEVEALQKEEMSDDFEEINSEIEEMNSFNIDDLDIIKVYGINENFVVVVAQQLDKKLPFLIDLEKNKILKLELESSNYSYNSPLGVKNNFILWLGEQNKIFAFDYKKLKLFTGELKPFDKSKGERAIMKLNGLGFDIIFDGDNFYFKNSKFGEVFSDGNSLSLEKFRQKYNLDNVLTKEKLSELGFSVEENQ